MPIEIAYVVRRPTPQGDELAGVGGPGWRADLETVIGQVEAGEHFYVQVSAVRFRIQVQRRGGHPALGTDPDESPWDQLRRLPACF